MGLLSIALDALSPTELAKVVVEYGPVIAAIIHFIELEADERKRAVAMDGITRGLQTAAETQDTTLLEAAIRSHVSSTGIRVD